eukprot:TRINITY_DN7451_c0_g1_i1.p1 TRINITY_DN7451_c0_g1~~TRINITY_DN7451_c0_g1_i1.p1  ORF type:complete len:397 (+),score=74.08 TRINITY_DN7451_c0_g1_i1:84-1274(+)
MMDVEGSASVDLSDDPDLSLSIPLESLFEEFCCPICFETIRDCFTTICGHNFCGKCIKECLNRKHSCPCCNHANEIKQLLKNHHHDRIVSILLKEKEVASKRYFEKLIKEGGNVPLSNNAAIPAKLSPIEEVFHRSMKKSLADYEEFYQDSQSKYRKTCDATKEAFRKRSEGIKDEKEIERLTRECDQRIKELDEAFQHSVGLLVSSYESYLQSAVPPPSFLPVTVSILIPSKSMAFHRVVLKPTDTGLDVKAIIEKKINETGDLFTGFNPSNRLVLRRMLVGQDGKQEEVPIGDERLPLGHLQIQQGDQILVKGNIQQKSDLPKECFGSMPFVKDQSIMDYYTCKECKYNWICKPCAETCHKGHTLTEFFLKHKPTWACCYCKKNAKNGSCSLNK